MKGRRINNLVKSSLSTFTLTLCRQGRGGIKERHGKYYQQKRVEVIYTIKGDVIITVTVYAFYGKWEGENADSI